MRIYLDNCVLNRPFDDQTQERIYLETQAFLMILKQLETNAIDLICSIANLYEADRIADIERKEKIKTYLGLAKLQMNLNENVPQRSIELNEMGFMGMDAVHLASAETGNVDYFISCDDRLLKTADKNKDRLLVKVLSLFEFMEIIYHAKDN